MQNIDIRQIGASDRRTWFHVSTDSGALVGTGYILEPQDGAPREVIFVTTRTGLGFTSRTEYKIRGCGWHTVSAFYGILATLDLKRGTCALCQRAVFWEDFLGCFLHEAEEHDLDHNARSGSLKVRFDESPEWAAEGRGTWNGWLVPAVTPEVRDEIAAWIEAHDSEGSDPEDTTVRDIRATEPGPDGLCVLNFGLCFQDAADFLPED